MMLSDLAAIGSFVSGAAVLASLAFLYFQLRQLSEQVKQDENNQRAIIRRGRVARSSAQLLRLAEPRHDGVWMKAVTAPESLANEEAFQFLLIPAARARDLYWA